MRRLARWLLLLCCSLTLAAPCRAQTRATDAELEAAVVFNLLLFVDWPEAALPGGDEFRLCAVDAGHRKPAFASLAGRRLRGHALVPTPLGRDLADLAKCHAVFVEGGDYRRLASVAAVARGAPLLVIGEGDQAVQHGAAIGLALAGNRIVFDVNLAAARTANLAISSKLLRIARSVYD